MCLKNDFYVFHYNVRSLRNKIEDIEVALQQSVCGIAFPVICFSEHWCSSDEIASIKLSGYKCASHFSRSVTKGGGVVIFVKSGLKYRNLNKINEMSLQNVYEITATQILDSKIVIVCIYRPPTSGFDIFMERLDKTLKVIASERIVLIVGDFNVNFIDNDSMKIQICDLFHTYGFAFVIKDPTRNNNCLDNVFLNCELKVVTSGVMELHLSDHKAIYAGVRLNLQKNLRVFLKVSVLLQYQIRVIFIHQLNR